jgi:hypothetical protein
MNEFKRIYCFTENDDLKVVVEDCDSNSKIIAHRKYHNITWSTQWRLKMLGAILKTYPSFYSNNIEVIIVGNPK